MVTATRGYKSAYQPTRAISQRIWSTFVVLLKLFILIIAPTILFLSALFLFLTVYGGHRYAITGKNEYCNAVQEPQYMKGGSHQWTDTTVAPRVVIQISDLHVNDMKAPKAERAKHHLELFFQYGLHLFDGAAEAVIVTGDLVNGVTWPSKLLGKRGIQKKSEWEWIYKYAMKVNQSVPWIAVPGNHDTFSGHINDIPELVQFSKTLIIDAKDRQAGKRVHRIEIDRDGDKLHLIAMDCTLPAPLNRPLNFFGDAEIVTTQLKESLEEIAERDQHVLVFSHYPSAVMKKGIAIHEMGRRTSPSGLRKPRFNAYLSGHLHDALGHAEDGLLAISRAGSFELEVPDMIASGTFRVFALDNGFISFKDFKVWHKYTENPLETVIVTNPPRAGFCSAGAGFASRSSTHIRFLVANHEKLFDKIQVEIDGDNLGNASKLNPTCAGATGQQNKTCLHVYGVKWNPEDYASGIHRLTIRSGVHSAKAHVFSLDGSPERSLKSSQSLFTSLFLGISNFDPVAYLLCYGGLFISFMLILPDLARKRSASIAIFVLIVLHLFTPFYIVADNFFQTRRSWGAAGLSGIFFFDQRFTEGIDIPYLMSVSSVWGAILPVSFLMRISRTKLFPTTHSYLFKSILLPFYLYPTMRWCLNIWGAHKMLGFILSLSALPTFLVLFWAMLSICFN